MIANDIDSVALHIARLNAEANDLPLQTDGTNLLDADVPPVDVVLAAEMFYEKDEASRMGAFLDRAHARGATVLIADAGRPFAPGPGMDVLLRRTVPANRDLEGVAERTVQILQRGSGVIRIYGPIE